MISRKSAFFAAALSCLFVHNFAYSGNLYKYVPYFQYLEDRGVVGFSDNSMISSNYETDINMFSVCEVISLDLNKESISEKKLCIGYYIEYFLEYGYLPYCHFRRIGRNFAKADACRRRIEVVRSFSDDFLNEDIAMMVNRRIRQYLLRLEMSFVMRGEMM